MPGDDLAFVTDQHRAGETEALDAVGDLANLLRRVLPRVAGIGLQGRGRAVFNIDSRELAHEQDITRPAFQMRIRDPFL